MGRFGMTIAALTFAAGTVTMAPGAQAAEVTPLQPRPVPTIVPSTPIQLMDCDGGTGRFGCGPGFIWHDGWRGYACYPC